MIRSNTPGRTITCPDCGATWTCPDFCYPGCHAIDPACEGPEYCRQCACIRMGFPDALVEVRENWHVHDKPVKSVEPVQMRMKL
jgi:hypothetical protein